MNYNKYLSLNFQYLGMDKSNIYTIRFQFLGPGCVPLYDEETRRVIISKTEGSEGFKKLCL